MHNEMIVSESVAERQAADDLLVPDPKVCKRYQISSMTLWRWDHDDSLAFPKPIYINGRKFRRLSELEAFERSPARCMRGRGRVSEAV